MRENCIQEKLAAPRCACLSLPSDRSKAKGKMFKNSIWDCGKLRFRASISSYDFEARGLILGMKNHLINAVKLVSQIFEFLSRRWDNLSLHANSY